MTLSCDNFLYVKKKTIVKINCEPNNQTKLPLVLFVQTEVLKYLRLVQLFARSNT